MNDYMPAILAADIPFNFVPFRLQQRLYCLHYDFEVVKLSFSCSFPRARFPNCSSKLSLAMEIKLSSRSQGEELISRFFSVHSLGKSHTGGAIQAALSCLLFPFPLQAAR